MVKSGVSREIYEKLFELIDKVGGHNATLHISKSPRWSGYFVQGFICPVAFFLNSDTEYWIVFGNGQEEKSWVEDQLKFRSIEDLLSGVKEI